MITAFLSKDCKDTKCHWSITGYLLTQINALQCHFLSLFHFPAIVDPCAANPCQNNGTCYGMSNGDYFCNCKVGFGKNYTSNVSSNISTFILSLLVPICTCSTLTHSVSLNNIWSMENTICIMKLLSDYFYKPVSCVFQYIIFIQVMKEPTVQFKWLMPVILTHVVVSWKELATTCQMVDTIVNANSHTLGRTALKVCY